MTTLEITPQDTMVSILDAVPSTEDIQVTAEGFTKLNLSDNLLKALSDMGFSAPSSIQAEAIPQIMQGTDIIAKAPTGSGKTAAFAIPILEKLDMNSENKSVQSLVLCPTRELAIQVHREFEKLTKYMDNVAVVSVYGGQQIDKQLSALKKRPQIVVATPGRLMDHLRRGSVSLDMLSLIVLDEADEMLDMGFREDIHTILEGTPENRQTVLFSATMAKDIVAITKKFQKSPNIVDVTDNLQSIPDIEQLYFEVSEKGKVELLMRLLDLHNVKLGLVFCNTKSNVDRVVEVLKTRGYFSDSLHGDMNQSQREKVMRGFRNGSVEILVATDVAGRGIDVKNVEAVFNYDMPRDDEDYTHRVGRTGRAGKSGIAFTFVTRNQVQSIRRIERANGVLINKREVPTYEELESARINVYESKIKNIVECDDLSEFIEKVQSLESEDMSLTKIAAALLKMSMNKESKKINKNVVFEDDFSGNDSGSSSRGRSRSRGRDRGFAGGRDRNDRGERSFRGGRSERSDRSERNESGENTERSERKGRGYRVEKNESSESPFGRAPRGNSDRSFGKSSREGGERKFGSRDNDRKPKQSNKMSLDDMIKSVKTLGEPQKSKPRFSSDESFGSAKQNKDYKSRGKNRRSFSKSK